jgi:hypothetical protein
VFVRGPDLKFVEGPGAAGPHREGWLAQRRVSSGSPVYDRRGGGGDHYFTGLACGAHATICNGAIEAGDTSRCLMAIVDSTNAGGEFVKRSRQSRALACTSRLRLAALEGPGRRPLEHAAVDVEA